MKDKITVIITIRNREAWRINKQVNSIRNAGAFPSFHVVDYGSDEEFAKQYKDLCQNLGLQYTHMYSEGLPWNKCRAINYGVRTAQTPFIVTSDVDMIYEGNPFQWCLDNYSDKCMYHIETYWLPKDSNKQKSQYAGHGNSGGFQFITKSAFEELGGYDERFEYWGQEDLDWPERLKKCGYTQIWLPMEYKIYHQYHAPSENGYLRPITVNYASKVFLYQNRQNPVKSQNWGRPLEEKDRQIFRYMKDNKPFIFQIPYDGIEQKLDEIINLSREYRFIQINLQPRIRERKLQKVRPFIEHIFTKPFHKFGINCEQEINRNFDMLYALLNVFMNTGLIDYYISSNLQYVYFLWKSDN